jgi:uncharacterized protein YdcH (DUF465 family)
MSIEGRMESLLRKHQELHNKVEVLEAEKAPEKYILPIKKQKLQIKDEMCHLKKRLDSQPVL